LAAGFLAAFAVRVDPRDDFTPDACCLATAAPYRGAIGARNLWPWIRSSRSSELRKR
jgi:hypothetical protein